MKNYVKRIVGKNTKKNNEEKMEGNLEMVRSKKMERKLKKNHICGDMIKNWIGRMCKGNKLRQLKERRNSPRKLKKKFISRLMKKSKEKRNKNKRESYIKRNNK